MRRFLLFGVSIASLLLLTYAGVMLAFSVPVTDEMVAANPSAPGGARALVLPIPDPASVPTRATSDAPALLLGGDADGAFLTSASDTRMGRALRYVAQGSEGTVDVDGVSIDVASFSGSQEGWIVKGEGEAEPWFLPEATTLGQVERYESTGRIALLFTGGAVGFVAPLVLVILTHAGARRAGPGATSAGASSFLCRECRAPLAPEADFCIRCGAWAKGEAA